MIKSVYTDRVLIERLIPETVNVQGYILPKDPDETVLVGKVVYIGEEVKNTSVGDIVVFDEFDHKEINLEGEILVIAKEETLICKVEKNEGH